MGELIALIIEQDKTVLHAIWFHGHLHVWGERVYATPVFNETPPTNSPTDNSFSITASELIDQLGEYWDTLLLASATQNELSLRLPYFRGELVGSCSKWWNDESEEFLQADNFETHTIESIVFGPADAIDFLAKTPKLASGWLAYGDSYAYWSRVAELVLELLAKQQFVPAVHRTGDGRCRGYWRVFIQDKHTADRLGCFIESMPPVCRAMEDEDDTHQASNLVESFLWRTVDALVRRCMQDDPLTHAIHERGQQSESLQIPWLRSLVHSNAWITASLADCATIHNKIEPWVSKLDPQRQQRTCRTCFQLAPPSHEDMEAATTDPVWILQLYMQACDDKSLIIEADMLSTGMSDDPTILPRPFDLGATQLREDVTRAARFFPPLADCAEPDGPVSCALTVEEAYQFLRDAAPLLEAEGFSVWLPKWWRSTRSRLHLMLDIEPDDQNSAVAKGHMRLDALVSYNWRVALGDDEISLEDISALAHAKTPLVKLGSQWTEVDPGDVARAMQFLEKQATGKMTLLEALRASYMADDMELGLPVGGLRAGGWIDEFLNATEGNQRIEPLEPPANFEGSLRPYQLRGLEWLSFLAELRLGACLADDMGLGKTIQLISLLLHERNKDATTRATLLLVPMSLVGNWQRELSKFGPTLNVLVHHGMDRLTGDAFIDEVSRMDVVLSTYGLAHRDRETLQRVPWHRITLDEAQNIKNYAAKQAQAVRALPALHRIALTGTPVENRLSELWSIMDFLNPGYLGSPTDFRRLFAVPIERHREEDRLHRLRQLIRPFVLRRLKSDPTILPDLPQKNEMTVYCNLTREQASLYEATVNEMMTQIDMTSGIQRRGLILATLVKLKQICNHPVQLLKDGSSMSQRSGKCERLTEMLEEVIAEGDKAVVFTQFRKMAELLEGHLRDKLQSPILLFHGGTSRKNRDEIIKRFQSDKSEESILILSLKAGGFGLNLTAASHVFHYDRWWNPAVEDQATDRTHRIGQTRQVQVHKFVCIGTLEERIAAMMEKKRQLAHSIIGSGQDWITELTTEALRDLFVLSRDAVGED